jgi:hypothetical protein
VIYLYRFQLWSKPRDGVLVEEWTNTSYGRAITHTDFPGLTFSPLEGLTHSEIRYDSERNAGQCRITVPRDFAVAAMFLGGYPYGCVRVRVIELDAEVDGIAKVIWPGKVRGCTFDEFTAELTCTNGNEELQRLGLRLNSGSRCQWALFSSDCGASESAYTRAGQVVAVSLDGLTVTTDLTGTNDWFKAGKFKALGQVRIVTRNVGGVLTLLAPVSGLVPGTAVTATKGCDRSASATSGCKAFNNYSNFSGFDGFETPRNIFSEGVA